MPRVDNPDASAIRYIPARVGQVPATVGASPLRLLPVLLNPPVAFLSEAESAGPGCGGGDGAGPHTKGKWTPPIAGAPRQAICAYGVNTPVDGDRS